AADVEAPPAKVELAATPSHAEPPAIVIPPPKSPENEPRLRYISDDDRKRLARAGRAMLADLAVIDKVPRTRQRPLLESQLRHFGLSDFATDVTDGRAADQDAPH